MVRGPMGSGLGDLRLPAKSVDRVAEMPASGSDAPGHGRGYPGLRPGRGLRIDSRPWPSTVRAPGRGWGGLWVLPSCPTTASTSRGSLAVSTRGVERIESPSRPLTLRASRQRAARSFHALSPDAAGALSEVA